MQDSKLSLASGERPFSIFRDDPLLRPRRDRFYQVGFNTHFQSFSSHRIGRVPRQTDAVRHKENQWPSLKNSIGRVCLSYTSLQMIRPKAGGVLWVVDSFSLFSPSP